MAAKTPRSRHSEPRVDPADKLVERRENSLLSLFELTHELGVGLDPYAISQLALFSLMGHFGTAAAALWVVPEAGSGAAVLVRCFGVREEGARSLGPALAAHAARQIEETRDSGRHGRLEVGVPEASLGLEVGLAVAVPISTQSRLVGVIALGARLGGEPYSALEHEYLAAAAGMVGVALENARLYHQMAESNRQLRDTNERLAEVARLKSEFLATVNHELLTPLSVVMAYLDILRTPQTSDVTCDAVAKASNSAARLETLLHNLLDFSGLEERALRLEIAPHDLAALLHEYAEKRRPGVLNRLREFTLELEPELPPASCDARRLLQVIDALVDNAVKFTLPGSSIRLRAARCPGDGAWIAIEVEDDGPGISADQLGTLFEPLRQIDGSTTREAGGLGLGLALARRLAEAMGGTLEARSEPGAGSIFALRLVAA